MKKKAKKKKSKTELFFVLDGNVFIEERKKDGEVISREEIDGHTVLGLMQEALRKGLDLLEKENG